MQLSVPQREFLLSTEGVEVLLLVRLELILVREVHILVFYAQGVLASIARHESVNDAKRHTFVVQRFPKFRMVRPCPEIALQRRLQNPALGIKVVSHVVLIFPDVVSNEWNKILLVGK